MLGQQLELTGNENENIPLYYHIVDNFHIQFGREEFCLVSGLKFSVENSTDYNKAKDPIPFRRRVFFSDLDERPIRGKDVGLLIESDVFKKLDDNDVVSLCCVGNLQLVLLGVEDRRHVPNWILSDPTNETDTKSYSIEGFAWAFKRRGYQQMKEKNDDMYEKMTRFMEDMRRVPEANITPIISDQHFGVSDISEFQSYQNLCDRARRDPQPSVYMMSPYTVLPPTTVLTKKRIDKTKKKGKTKKLSPLNLGNTFADENVSVDDVTITGVYANKRWGSSSGDWSNKLG
nr:hypothetical protein [Tanacetum cinerariifolium]